jgi:hypothetical protein
MTEAPEPSDIIYENLKYDEKYKRKNNWLVGICFTVLFVIIFYWMTRLRAIPGRLLTNYPPNMNCEAVSLKYGFDHVKN